MPSSSGPTQGAERHGEPVRRWQRRPRFAAALRGAIVVLPLAVSLLFTLAMGRWFPPEDLGVNRWLWIGLVFVAANVLLYVLARAARALIPVAGLMALSLVFPDQAPSRSRAALRRGSSAKMLRQLQEAVEANDDSAGALRSEYLVQLLKDMNRHDRLTRGHSERVRAYSELLGEELGISGEEMEKLRWGALLHDVGKLEVPSEILNKDGRPDAKEWEILKTHPAKASIYLAPIADWLGEWALAAEHHHARFDGDGYPVDLSGTDISFPGRLVAVADAYDVMTSARSYKAPLSAEVARQELVSCSGSQFDPKIVSAFLRIGLGDLQTIAGPWGWLANLTGSAQIPVQAATGAATAVATATAAVAAVVAAPAVTEPPAVVAFEEPAVQTLNAADDVFTLDEDTTILLPVLDNDARTPVGWISEVSSAENGVAVIEGEAIRYTPSMDFFGQDSFEYTVTDDAGRESRAVVSLVVNGVQDAPEIGAIDARISESATLGTTVAQVPISDPDADVLRVALEGRDAGNFEIDADGTISLARPLDFERQSRYEVIVAVTDENTITRATIPIVVLDVAEAAPTTTIAPTTTTTAAPTTTTAAPTTTVAPTTTTTLPVNRAPIATRDDEAILEDVTAVFDVLANDSDPDGDPLTVTAVSGAVNGDATLEAGGIRYTPDPNYFGIETLTYEVSDGTNPPVAGILRVEIFSFFDPPVAVGESLVLFEDEVGQTNITLNDSDVDGDPLMWTIPNASVEGGSLSISGGVVTYVPPPNFNGTDSFSYDVSDGVSTPSATVSITVNPVQDAPVVANDSGTIAEDAPLGSALGTLVASDADGDALTFAIVGGDPLGQFAVSNTGEITLDAPLDRETEDRYDLLVEVSDGVDTSTATFVVTVTDTNEAPVARGHTFQTLEDLAVPIDLIDWADDPEVDPLTFAVDTPPLNGTVVQTGSMLTYLPDPDYFGSDSFTYTATDSPGGLVSNTATITIDMLEVNDAPVAVHDDGPDFTTLEDTVLTFNATDLLANDIDVDDTLDPAEVQIVLDPSAPGVGTLSFDAGTGVFTFVPANDFHGDLTFEYTVSDGSLTSAPAEVEIEIVSVNDAPAPQDDHLSTVFPLPGTVIDVKANDVDIEGDPLTVVSVTDGAFGTTVSVRDGAFGTTSVNANGRITYLPGAVFSPTDEFTYVVSDPQGAQSIGIVKVQISEPIDGDNVPFGVDVCPFDFDPFQLDADGDGIGDVCDPTPNNGSALTVESPDSALASNTPGSTSVVAGDLNGDGFDDLVVGKIGGQSAEVWLNDGQGAFVERTQVNAIGSSSRTNDVDLGDLDNDGDLDLVVAQQDGTVRVYLNNGTGRFDPSTVFAAPANGQVARAIDIGFVDNDNRLDVVVARENSGNATADGSAVYLNTGNANGEPTFNNRHSLGANGLSVQITNVDNAGAAEILIGGIPLNSLWRVAGNGTFVGTASSQEATAAVVLVGDVSGDGFDDFIWAQPSEDEVRVLVNDTMGTEFFETDEIDIGAVDALAVGDLDGDGFNDLLVADAIEDRWRAFLNQGDATFAEDVTAPLFSGASDIAIADFDGDGVADIVSVSDSGDDYIYLRG